MKTYAEAKGKRPFDWNDFLDRAIAGNITELEVTKAVTLARDWVTCACGNQCDAIPRLDYGCPDDKELADLGICFLKYVYTRAFETAKLYLVAIEKRSTELLAEMEAQK